MKTLLRCRNSTTVFLRHRLKKKEGLPIAQIVRALSDGFQLFPQISPGFPKQQHVTLDALEQDRIPMFLSKSAACASWFCLSKVIWHPFFELHFDCVSFEWDSTRHRKTDALRPDRNVSPDCMLATGTRFVSLLATACSVTMSQATGGSNYLKPRRVRQLTGERAQSNE